MTERVALYMRVSSEEQRERATIEGQHEFLQEYRKLYKLDVVEVYRDEGISGTVPLHERPAAGRLLEDAEAGKFDVVLVYKLDRIGRQLLVVVDAHDRLQEAGVSLRSATEPIDTSNPSGRLIFQMLASFAEFERGAILERTQAGMHRAWRNGKGFGLVPYGYDIGEDGRFRIVESEAAVVREIISNIAAGSTLYREAARLNALEVPGPGARYRKGPRQPSARWSRNAVSRIVRRTAYAGTHRVEVNSGAECIERDCPAIVPPELQQKALEQLAENKRLVTRNNDRKYVLSGLITCEVCGSACVGYPSTAHGKKRYYYKCRDDRASHGRKAPRGHAPFVRAEWVEDLVWQDIKRFLQNPGEVLQRLKESADADEETGALSERRSQLAKRLRDKQAEKDRYVKLYAQGHLDDAELGDYLQDVNLQAEQLRLLLDSVEAQLSERSREQQTAQTTAAWLATLRERIAEVEADTEEAYSTRRELMKLLVESITAGRDEERRVRLEITYRFGPAGASPTGETPEAARGAHEGQGADADAVPQSLQKGSPIRGSASKQSRHKTSLARRSQPTHR